GAGDPSEARERELIYRALLELRLEMRELKEQVLRALSGTAARHEARDRDAFEGDPGDYVIVRESEREPFGPHIEDVPYEIEPEAGRERALAAPLAGPLAPYRPPNGPPPPPAPSPPEPPPADEEADLPSLADAERDLI